MSDELKSIQRRAASFISDHDPFGDHFSAHDFAQLDPNGGYTTIETVARKDEFAWVIEKHFDGVLKYYAPTAPGEWTADHMKACRFSRKEDAEAVQWQHVSRGHLPVLGTRVCEHGWH